MRISDWSSDVCSSDLLAVLRRANLALDGVAGAQAIFADLVGRDIDIVGTGKIIGLGAAQEAEAVGQHLDRPRSDDFLALFGEFLEDREHQILLAQRRRAFDPQFLGHFDELRGRFGLEFFQMHEWSPTYRTYWENSFNRA